MLLHSARIHGCRLLASKNLKNFQNLQVYEALKPVLVEKDKAEAYLQVILNLN